MSEPSTPPCCDAARLEVDYPEKLNRVTTLFRLILVIPIAIVIGCSPRARRQTVYDETGQVVSTTSGGIAAGLFMATLLMILFRQRYPRWWFDFALELARFGARVGAYVVLLTDQYPSTVEEQSVHLELDYPDVERDLNRWLPLVKWLLAIPHFIVLFFLSVGRLLRGRHRLVRDPVHRALSARAVRLRRRRRPLVAARRGLRVPARHRPSLPPPWTERAVPAGSGKFVDYLGCPSTPRRLSGPRTFGRQALGQADDDRRVADLVDPRDAGGRACGEHPVTRRR